MHCCDAACFSPNKLHSLMVWGVSLPQQKCLWLLSAMEPSAGMVRENLGMDGAEHCHM